MGKKSDASLSFEQLQEIITSIYDAALDENRWGSVLNTLALSLQADQGHMRILDIESKDSQNVYTFNKDEYWTKAYNDYYIHIDPWVEICLKPDATTLDCTHHLLPDKQYEAMEIYRDFSAPQDIHYGVGGSINISTDSTCYITFQRSKRHDGFEPQYLNMLHAIAPHLKKAVLINKKTQNIKFENNILGEALSRVNCPVALVNSYGSILYINELAEKFVNDTEDVGIKNNCLSLNGSKENNQLHNLIHQATGSDKEEEIIRGGAMHFSPRDAHSSVSILVSPVNSSKVNLGAPQSAVALILFNANNHTIKLTIESLIGLYGFTPAEARLALYLSQGMTLEEISTKLSRSMSTLRSQLRASFSKLGVSRQSDLVRIINTGPAAMINNKN